MILISVRNKNLFFISKRKNLFQINFFGFGKKYKLKDVVQECHAYNSKQNKWKLFPLKEGAFGFDNIAICIMYILKKVKTSEKLKNIDIENCQIMYIEHGLKIIHIGVIMNHGNMMII